MGQGRGGESGAVILLSGKVNPMDIRESILNHSKFVNSNAGKVTNEPDTKRVLVISFLEDVLGINSRDPHEMKSEYPADWGDRNHKAVDYALMFDDKPLVIIEAKRARKSLDGEPLTQLRGYFSVIPEARIGILTDGIKYRFYADLDDSKGLDSVPFLEIDFSKLDGMPFADVGRFEKTGFNPDQVLQWAKDRSRIERLQGAVTDALRRELSEPSDQFVGLFIDKLKAGRKAKTLIAEFRGYLRTAISGLVSVVPANEGQPQPSPPTLEGDWLAIANFTAEPGTSAPMRICFPGESPRDLKNWRALTTETADWLFRSGKIRIGDAPYRFGKRSGGIINTESTSAQAKNMFAPHRIGGQDLYIESHGDSHAQVNRVRALLDLFSVDPETITVKPQ